MLHATVGSSVALFCYGHFSTPMDRHYERNSANPIYNNRNGDVLVLNAILCRTEIVIFNLDK